MKKYQRCTRCIMDNRSDEHITFNEKGQCNYCTTALSMYDKVYYPNNKGQIEIQKLITRLKNENKKKTYDCIMGVSGGLDSSYLLYLGYKWGLRILAIHVDDGFDTEISISNLEKLSKATNIEIVNVKPDLVQFYELTKAYMRAGVPNLAVMQDNMTLKVLFDYARKTKIKTFLSGGNFALESILQQGNSYTTNDVVNIKAINRKFGSGPINKLKFISSFQRLWYQKVYKIEYIRPLNFINYNKNVAMKELSEFCGFSYYGSKLHENLFTKFLQIYWFVKKFNVDKRTSHLSSLIISDQMTRDEALIEMNKPLYDEIEMQNEISTMLNILNMSQQEFVDIMNQPAHQHTDYKTSRFEDYWNIIRRIRNYFRLGKKNGKH